MSSQINTYVMWGLMLPMEEAEAMYGKYAADKDVDFYDVCAPYVDNAFKKDSINPKNDLTIIFGEETFVIGHVTHRSGEYGYFTNEEDLAITIPNMPNPSEPEQAVKYAGWNMGLQKALQEIGIQTPTLGLRLQWHVVTNYR